MTKRRTTKRRSPPPAKRSYRVEWIAIGIAVVLALVVVDAKWFHILPFFDEQTPAQVITDSDAPLARFFTPEVRAWRADILKWAAAYGVNPNVIAIVIQIESCGDPEAFSVAGAVGLMQVMPYHFDDGENMLNPDTNVQEGMEVFYECLTQFADWDLGLALACYNGGPSVTVSDPDTWAYETQNYYYWATGLWDDVVAGNDSSDTLDEWLDAGGEGLCHQAALVAQE